jgi:hypothetical protein
MQKLEKWLKVLAVCEIIQTIVVLITSVFVLSDDPEDVPEDDDNITGFYLDD